MERLTAWDRGHAYYKKCFEEPCLGGGCEIEDCKLKIDICGNLARYEDLGVTPDQIREIDKLYLEKCEEVNGLKKEMVKLVEEQPTAYDVDKVIEKLEATACGEWGYPSVMEFDDVVGIVKAGGR